MQHKKSIPKALFFIFTAIVCLFFFFRNIYLPSPKNTQAAIAPLSVTVTFPPGYKAPSPADAQATIFAKLSGTQQQTTFFDNYPRDFPHYYSYANKLFDGGVFFSNGSNIPIPGLVLTVTGPNNCNPCQVNNKADIPFTITAIYSGTATLVITDTIPSNATLVSKSGTATTPDANTVTWNLAANTSTTDNSDPNTPKKKWVLTITLHPKKDNDLIHNVVYAEAGNACLCLDPKNIKQSTDYKFSPNNGFTCSQQTGANSYCGTDSYCDPAKSGKTDNVCTQVTNCACNTHNLSSDLDNTFTCNNGHNTLSNSCDSSNMICSGKVTTGFPCEVPQAKCTCTGQQSTGGIGNVYTYTCKNSNNQTISGACGIGKTCDDTRTGGLPCR